MLHRRDICNGEGRRAEVGATKREMKIMAIVDRHGLPLSVSTHAANHQYISSQVEYYPVSFYGPGKRASVLPISR